MTRKTQDPEILLYGDRAPGFCGCRKASVRCVVIQNIGTSLILAFIHFGCFSHVVNTRFTLRCNYSMQIWGCQAILGIFNLFFKQREQRRTVRNCAARYGTPCRFSMRKLQQKAPVRGQGTRGGDGTFSCSHLGRLRCGERRTAQDGMQDRPDQRRTRMPRAARTSRAASVSAAVGIGVSTVASG